MGLYTSASAHINPNAVRENKNAYRMDCAQATSEEDQAINNVRARLLAGGDVWWDGEDGLYIVPNVDASSGADEVSSLFAGAVWVGGLDPAGNLKIAAQTYGTAAGNTDFWPGPLSFDGTVDQQTCADWDKHFRVLGSDIEKHVKAYQALAAEQDSASTEIIELELATIPTEVLGWPARGNKEFFRIHGFELPNTTQGLAPFWDEDGDGLYSPEFGDYPIIEIRGCNEPQYPDEMWFWIYNDAGGVHTQTNGDPIQMEIQVQAFAYATNDQLNDMTFQRYKLINRAVESIDSTFFAMWADPDLGCHEDDYIGCDVSRSLMYVYNEDAADGNPGCNCPGGVRTYCTSVPMLGIDYFRGPLGPHYILTQEEVDALSQDDQQRVATRILTTSDEFDRNLYEIGEEVLALPLKFGDTTPPDLNLELGMSSFIYYNNGNVGSPLPGTTDPGTGSEYYNYMTGTWRDDTPFTQGGNGYGGTLPTNYVFPGNPSDDDDWSMCAEGTPFGDRRTVQASGPFRLDPGAVNELIIGVPWVADVDYPCPDLKEIQFADDIAQALFDNCFDITDGPDAPDVCVVELDRQLVLVLSNEEGSNNFGEQYQELDLRAPTTLEDEERLYRFEGYKIFQLANADVSVGDINDPSKAALVAQFDVENGVDEIYNWTSVANPGVGPSDVWTPNLRAEGNDRGIRHTFTVENDRFATDDVRLINHKKYYFMAISYAYNSYEAFNPNTTVGQPTPYLEGRRNIRTYTAIPRPITDRALGAFYGDGAVVTRLDGIGDGGNFLDISDETRLSICDGTFDGEIVYKPGMAPIDVQVYDPLRVKDGNYILKIVDGNLGNDELEEDATWELSNEDDPSFAIISERGISRLNEQLIAELGFSISIAQVPDAGDPLAIDNGGIGQTVTYNDPDSDPWLSWVLNASDIEGVGFPLGQFFNYLPTGSGQLYFDEDPQGDLSQLGTATFVPYTLTEYRLTPQNSVVTPAWINSNSNLVHSRNPLSSLNNVDIVYTSDKSKWSRCIVTEAASPAYYGPQDQGGLDIPTEGDVPNFSLRGGDSVGKNDNDGDGLADPDGDGTGMGWFPGYAIDVETGKRLNIFFGENSTFDGSLVLENYDNGVATGRDMMWNPTSQQFLDVPGNNIGFYNFLMGAQHFVYVTDQEYDGCAQLRQDIQSSSPIARLKAYEIIKWTSFPIVSLGSELLPLNGNDQPGLIPNDVTVKVRVNNPYEVETGTGICNGYPTYRFSLSGKAAAFNDDQRAYDEQLDMINVVPNPYYGYSQYETSQFTNTVKITNLPAKCNVTIYSLDGKFIRQYRRDEQELAKPLSNAGVLTSQINPDIEWDLKNNKSIPVASGVYLIHVEAEGLGERVIKWFGVARQFDPSGL